MIDDASAPSADKCADCGAGLNAGEAKCFTVCEYCWTKHYPALAASSTPDSERLTRQAISISAMLSDAGVSAMPIEEAVRRLLTDIECLKSEQATCRKHTDPLVCLACEAEEDARPEWHTPIHRVTPPRLRGEPLREANVAASSTPPSDLVNRRANNLARIVNQICSQEGIDLPLSICMKLVTLFDAALSQTKDPR